MQHRLRVYYFACFAALGAYVPFFPPWLEARGIRGIWMGAITATLPAMSLVGPPAFGALADAFGKRTSLLRVACLGTFVAFAALAAAGFAKIALGFVPLFAAVLVFAVFRSPMVMMADIITIEEERRTGVAYAKIRLWGSLGFLAMAAGAGRIIDPIDPALLPAAIALPLLIALAAALTLVEPQHLVEPNRSSRGLARSLLARPDFKLFLLVIFLHNVGHSNHEINISLQVRALGGSDQLAGILWATGVLCEVFLMMAGDRIFSRISPARGLSIPLFVAAGRWLAISTITSPYVLLAIQPLHAITFGLAWISSLAFIKDRTGPGAAGTAQGLFTAACSAGSVAGMLVWSDLYKRQGGSTTFLAAALVSLVGALVSVPFARSAVGKEIASSPREE